MCPLVAKRLYYGYVHCFLHRVLASFIFTDTYVSINTTFSCNDHGRFADCSGIGFRARRIFDCYYHRDINHSDKLDYFIEYHDPDEYCCASGTNQCPEDSIGCVGQASDRPWWVCEYHRAVS